MQFSHTDWKQKIESPLGELLLIGSDKGLKALLFPKGKMATKYKDEIKSLKQDPNKEILIKTKQQIKEYFKGKREKFDLPLEIEGTAFQKQAWKFLGNIPYGKTRSYKQQAKALGDEKKARAVGNANGLNPLSIIIPCHRVLTTSGKLGGYSGGEGIKERLLALETTI